MNTPWDKDWQEAQKLYMEALASFGATTTQNKTSAAQSSEWQKALDYWWQTSSTNMPDDTQIIFSNLLQQSKSWFSITEQFDDLLKIISSNDDKALDWSSAFDKHIQKMKLQLQDGFANANSDNWQFASSSPIDNWQKLFNTMFSGGETTSNQFSEIQANFEKFSSLGNLGPNRQAHEQMQEGLRLWQKYQDNYQAYRETFNNIGLKSLDKLQEKVLALGKQEKSISSLRDLYDLWVDSHEEAYSDFVLTEDYSKLYGQLINSMLAFRAHSQQFFSESSKFLNLPTVDKQDALQQELRDVKQQQELDKKRIKLLEEKINHLDSMSSRETKSSMVPKKKTGKKKITRKKTGPQSGNVKK